jgi:phenylalanyl-tRNA synthetase beta subunit
VELFDEYLGIEEGTKSLAYHYRLRAPDRTLAGPEIGKVREQLVEAAASLGARLRT